MFYVTNKDGRVIAKSKSITELLAKLSEQYPQIPLIEAAGCNVQMPKDLRLNYISR